MASKQMLVVTAAVVAAFLPALASAAVHEVGDSNGWVLGFDYVAWAARKEFRVGDTLVFKYDRANHNVIEVSGADFKTCTKPVSASVWNSGNDWVTLEKEGRRWFFCGVGDHCQKNMKLNITILANSGGAPTPASAPRASFPPRASIP